ncbi:hypothetical protein AMTR_s00152p00049250 [Amborella trichopoda]|uniref:Uncharacterized protein n=1 Tax=Amborella trichopoda TaxID=13333 RepID=W1PKC6_AMBTC|nr:hypothetical protein AMTR_s00152p00049250 [Amborella trichopoda]
MAAKEKDTIAVEITPITAEKVLKVGIMLDPKSRDITSMRKMVVHICQEVEHHQNMSDFYQGEVEWVKELLELSRVDRMIRFGE